MKSIPEISIIVCCYNQGKYLERCIRSLTHQDLIGHDEYEIIVVNDGSVDMTSIVLKQMSILPQLRIITNPENLGLPNSANIGIQKALGRFIVRVDSDDYVLRNFLYMGRLFLNKNRTYQAVACDYYEVNDSEETIRQVDCFQNQIACGIFFRKEALYELGLYNEEFKMREGHELRQRFDQKFKMGHLQFPIYKYRKHGENRTLNQAQVGAFDSKLKDTPTKK